MALEKNIALDSGVTATYHKIMKVELNQIEDITKIQIGYYLDAASAAAGKDPLKTEWITKPTAITLVEMGVSNPVALSYTFLKTLAEFDAASDV